MGDFLLDFREAGTRRQSATRAASLLKFCEDTRAEIFDRDAFSLVLTRVDEPELWRACERGPKGSRRLVALAGRIALEEKEWEQAMKVEGAGGLACKAMLQKYLQGGIGALEGLNGNFVALVHDEHLGKFHLVTDRCGMLLAYAQVDRQQPPVFGSHADVLADLLGESQNWDLGSLAEFLMTSRVSFPYTYYRNLRALEPGSIHTIGLQRGLAVFESSRQYLRFDFKIDEQAKEKELAQELAAVFTKSIRRRTLPLFGRTGIGLSGGLDSRAVLSAADPRSDLRAFCLFDEENSELRAAKAIAQAAQVEMIPIRRDFEYYGNSAELGVRISGGTGCVTCNHFLGIRGRLKELGITNILTGCYCDYLFKGLAINLKESWLSRSDRLAEFCFEFYDSFHWLKTPWRAEVEARLKSQFPESANGRLSGNAWLEVQRKRTFPLANEQDLAQRVVPQRVMPWYLPIVDNDVIDTYLKIPTEFKLNAGVFKKMLPLVCRDGLCGIPDSNTGAKVDVAWPQYALARVLSSMRNRFTESFKPGMATRGSWPNWRHYFQRSETVGALWQRPNRLAREVFTTILRSDPLARHPGEYADSEVVLFQRLFTLKLWFDQRV